MTNHVMTTEMLAAGNSYLDDGTRRTQWEERGKLLFNTFRIDNKRVSTQVRNLQAVTLSAQRLADVEAFIKNQMGKDSGQTSQKWRQVGESLLKDIDGIFRTTDSKQSGFLLGDISQEITRNQIRLVRLYLARGWVKSVVASYMYQKALQEMHDGEHEVQT